MSQKNRADSSGYENSDLKADATYEIMEFTERRGPDHGKADSGVADSPPRSSKDRRQIFLLLVVVNGVLLGIILVLVAVHYSHSTRGVHNTLNGISSLRTEEYWLIYQNAFYHFSAGRGSCQSAKDFCAERNATLAHAMLESKQGWWVSQAGGKDFWVEDMDRTHFVDSLSDDEDTLNGEPEESSGQAAPCPCALLSTGRVPPRPDGCDGDHRWICQRNIFHHSQ
ncbi:uncharacterized protein LOC136768004 isoform X2 [Amia ocellicauda]|uniref:uncharacterized protein LOC136768004 isoform X2 n=1 Tax=Amia ocellicauda TaxID=2972642 RepID=UPI003463E5F7